MKRYSLTSAAALTVALFVVSELGLAQGLQPNPLPPRPAAGGTQPAAAASRPQPQPDAATMGGQEPEFPEVPNYEALGMEPVQREIGLNADQRQRLLDLGRRFSTEMQQLWGGLGNVPPEQRSARMQELQNRMQQRSEAYRQEMDKILTPQQAERVRQISSRLRTGFMLMNARALDQVGLSPEQRQQLTQLRQNMEDRMHQLQTEFSEKSLAVLTPQQRQQLEQLGSQGPGAGPVSTATRSVSPQSGSGPPAVRPQ